MDSHENCFNMPVVTTASFDDVDESKSVISANFPNYDDAFPDLPLTGAKNASSASLTNGLNSNKSNIAKNLPPAVLPSKKNCGNNFNFFIQFNNCRFSTHHKDVYNVVKEISKELGISIDITRSREGYLLHIICKADMMSIAKKRLEKDILAPMYDTVSVPHEYHGFILGRNGQNLRDIENSTGIKIKMPKAFNQSDLIELWGTTDSIRVAKEKVLYLYQEQLKRSRESVSISKVYHPFICGPFNQRLDALMEATGTKIIMPLPHVDSDIIKITGEREGVSKASAALMEALHEITSDCHTIIIHIPKSQHRYVYGNRGSGLSEILQQTGVSVELPKSDSDSDEVILRGPLNNFGTALSLTMAKADSVVQKTVAAPIWLHRYLIGKQGCNLQAIIKEHPQVHIDFTGSENNSVEGEIPSPDVIGPIELTGPRESVSKVAEVLETQVNELKASRACIDVKVATDHLKNFSEDRVLAKIQRENSCFIRSFKDQHGQSTSFSNVRIEGPPGLIERAKKEFLALVEKWDNETVKNVWVDQKFHSRLIGTHGSNIREFKEKYPLVKISIPDSNSESNIVTLRGPRDDVDAVDEKIRTIYADLANFVELSVHIPVAWQQTLFHKHVELVRSIEQEADGGVRLKYLQTSADAGRKQISRKNCNSSQSIDLVLINGPKQNAEKAKNLLLSVVQQNESSICSEKIQCPDELRPCLIGKGGNVVENIRIKSKGAHIFFPEVNEDQTRNVITIIGNKESVGNAKTLLQQKIKALEDTIEATCVIPQRWHRNFFIRRNQLLDEISRSCGNVSIFFPKVNSEPPNHEVVTVKGARDYVTKAVERLRSEVDRMAAQVNIEFAVPRQHYGLLIGRNGDQVRELRDEFDVNIKFPSNENDHMIVITGQLEQCEAAKVKMLEMVPLEVDLHLPAEYHLKLIGQKGSEIQSLQKKFNVFINVSLPTESVGTETELSALSSHFGGESKPSLCSKSRDLIQVRGSSKNIEELKHELAKRVQQWDEEKADRIARNFETTIQVPLQYHRSLIGQRGANINKLRQEYNVTIQMPQLNADGDDCETVLIRGYKADTEKAKEAIQKRISYLDSVAIEELNLPHEIHNRIIGQGGANLKKIQSRYDVEIIFPSLSRNQKDEAPGIRDTVRVIGLRENLDQCCDYLINKANDMLDDYREKQYLFELTASKEAADYPACDFGTESSRVVNKLQMGFHVVGGPYQLDISDQAQFPSIVRNFATTSIQPSL